MSLASLGRKAQALHGAGVPFGAGPNQEMSVAGNGTKRRKTIRGLRPNHTSTPTPSRAGRPVPIERVSADYHRHLLRDRTELGKFLEGHEPMVRAVAKRLFRRHWSISALPGRVLPGENERVVTMGDLIQAGQIGQMEALHAYDPTRGVKWSTWACWKIRSKMQDELMSSSDDAMRLPAHVRDKRDQLINTPEDVRDGAKLREVNQTIRRVSYPMRLDQVVGNDGDTLSDVLPGKPDDHGHIYAREQADLIRAALERIAGDRPYRDPPETYGERVAAAVWSEPRPIRFDRVKVLVAEKSEPPPPRLAKRIRYGIDQALRKGWVEVHQNGGAPRYGQAGDPRPRPDDVRNIEIMAWRIGVADPIGRTRTLEEIGEDHGLTRSRVQQIEQEWMPKLRRELVGVA